MSTRCFCSSLSLCSFAINFSYPVRGNYLCVQLVTYLFWTDYKALPPTTQIDIALNIPRRTDTDCAHFRFIIMKLFAVFQLLALAGLPTGRAGSSHPAVVARDFDPNRLASDGTWAKFRCKGEQLMQAMKGSEQEAAKIMNLPAAQSEWSGDLKGWCTSKHLDIQPCLF